MKTIPIALLVLVLAPASWATTWHVAKDGSGDFTVIQDAVDAAEPGDTILVGPGHYDEVRPIPFWSGYNAVVATNKSGLEIRGAGVDQTIIGADYISSNYRTIVAFDQVLLEGLMISDASIIGGYSGIYFSGNGLQVENCVFRVSRSGVTLFYSNDCVITVSQFRDIQEFGVVVFGGGASNILIEDCQFSGIIQGVNIQAMYDAVIRDCIMTDILLSVQFEQGSRGEITNLHATGRDGVQYGIGVTINSGSRATLIDCVIDWSMTNTGALSVVNGATVSGHGNVLRGGDLYTISLLGPQAIDGFYNNEIYRARQFTVLARYWGDTTQPPVHVDMTNNYWGTNDPDVIAEWILDYHDYPGQHGWCMVIDYIPFISGPVPVQQQTWTEVKGLFRD
jgi:hypothetical protein